MNVRPATEADSRLVFDWRNDPVTISTFRTGRVEWDGHSKWFPVQLSKDGTVCLIGEHDGKPCGVIWFHKNRSGVWETSVNLAPEFRGKKLSVPLLNTSLEWMRVHKSAEHFSTEIKNDNLPSIKMFEHCGYLFVFQSPDFGAYYAAPPQ